MDVPVARGVRSLPVVLYSAGLGDPRTWGTHLVADLASRGYVVVTVDHPYDASEVRFPDGRLVESVLPSLAGKPGTDVGAVLRKAVRARVDDTRSVLDALAGPALRRGLPHGLAQAMDLRRVGMAGHSAGVHGRAGHARRPADPGRGQPGRHHGLPRPRRHGPPLEQRRAGRPGRAVPADGLGRRE
ncbi:hypothetical protein ACFQ2B_19405 [Streptomyces stramineus]